MCSEFLAGTHFVDCFFAVEIPIFSVISDGSIKSLILPSISIAIPIACISIRSFARCCNKRIKK